MIATKRKIASWLFGVAVLALACARQSGETPAGTAAVVEAPPTKQAAPISPARPASSAPVVEAPPVVPAPPVAEAATPSAPVASTRARRMPPQNEHDCKACNGEWRVHGIAPKPSCNCRTSDGGKRCRDGIECEGLCIAADDPERQVTAPGPPARGFFVGHCSKFAAVFGCHRPLDDGASAKPVDLTEPPQMICAD
jgi:hypothetical protein